jgi:hypothetical protein
VPARVVSVLPVDVEAAAEHAVEDVLKPRHQAVGRQRGGVAEQQEAALAEQEVDRRGVRGDEHERRAVVVAEREPDAHRRTGLAQRDRRVPVTGHDALDDRRQPLAEVA